MQNKANLPEAESNASSVSTKDYEDFILYKSQKTNPIQSQSNPKQTQFSKRPKINLNFYSTMYYENKSNWTLVENKPNSNPIKPNFSVRRIYANE